MARESTVGSRPLDWSLEDQGDRVGPSWDHSRMSAGSKRQGTKTGRGSSNSVQIHSVKPLQCQATSHASGHQVSGWDQVERVVGPDLGPQGGHAGEGWSTVAR